MEKSNYIESGFFSQSEINVDILSVCSSKNKFGDYHRSHKIKVKYVCLIKDKSFNNINFIFKEYYPRI
jgi:hypothetical protein